MTKEQKDWIDTASYESLLRKVRFAPIGDVMFQGSSGEYYGKVMDARRKEIGAAGHTATSKRIGW